MHRGVGKIAAIKNDVAADDIDDVDDAPSTIIIRRSKQQYVVKNNKMMETSSSNNVKKKTRRWYMIILLFIILLLVFVTLTFLDIRTFIGPSTMYNNNDSTLLPTTTTSSAASAAASAVTEINDYHHQNNDDDDDDDVCKEDYILPTKMVLDHIKVATQSQLHSLLLDSSSSSSSRLPRILCFIMTYEQNHYTNVMDVLTTWGKRCDKLVLASNKTETLMVMEEGFNQTTRSYYETVTMKTKSTYNNLYNKLNETLHYIYDNYYNESYYDWYLKVDDDTYVIMENLHYFLLFQQQQQQKQGQQQGERPMIYGRQFNLELDKLINKIDDVEFAKHVIQKSKSNAAGTGGGGNNKFIFNSGGAGYVFNNAYLKQVVHALDYVPPSSSSSKTTRPEHNVYEYMAPRGYLIDLNMQSTADNTSATGGNDGNKNTKKKRNNNKKKKIENNKQQQHPLFKPTRCPEDVCLALTGYMSSSMNNLLLIPPSTRDEYGLQRFHFWNPHDMYHLPKKSWVYNMHEHVGGVQDGFNCCSEYSISFHYMNNMKKSDRDKFKGNVQHQNYMQYMEQQLYQCRH